MKRTFLTLFILGLSFSAFAQKAVTIYKKDGTVTFIKASNIDSITFKTPLAIGDTYQGGKIFYLDASGDHGLIAATSDQSTGTKWDNAGIPKATNTSYKQGVGFGNECTCVAVNIAASANAALLCYNLTLNGYSDWYLPSLDELELMYQQKAIIGGFSSASYWSSNEEGSNFAYYQNFSTGAKNTNVKSTIYYVRAIRSF